MKALLIDISQLLTPDQKQPHLNFFKDWLEDEDKMNILDNRQ